MCYDRSIMKPSSGAQPSEFSGKVARRTTNSTKAEVPIGSSAGARECERPCYHGTTGPGVMKVIPNPTEWENDLVVFMRQKKSRVCSTDSDSGVSTESDVEEDANCRSDTMYTNKCAAYWKGRNTHGPQERLVFHPTAQASQQEVTSRITNARGFPSVRGLIRLSRPNQTQFEQEVMELDRKAALMQQFLLGWS